MKLGTWFETKKRDSGESFTTLKDGRPEWLQDAVRDAHGDMLPDDWVYAECQAACEAIDEGSLDEDHVHEYVDGRVDVYTRDRFQWAADHCLSDLFAQAEEQASELGGNEDASMADRLGSIQYGAIESIAQTILSAASGASEEETEQ